MEDEGIPVHREIGFHDVRELVIADWGSWPRELGPHPFADGLGEAVLRQDYVAGGMIAPAPSGED